MNSQISSVRLHPRPSTSCTSVSQLNDSSLSCYFSQEPCKMASVCILGSRLQNQASLILNWQGRTLGQGKSPLASNYTLFHVGPLLTWIKATGNGLIYLLTGLRIYTGEYKAQGPTLCPTEGRALRGPRALDSPVQARKPVSKKFIAWLKFQFFLHS